MTARIWFQLCQQFLFERLSNDARARSGYTKQLCPGETTLLTPSLTATAMSAPDRWYDNSRDHRKVHPITNSAWGNRKT